jgi:hypothetical protein
MGKYRCARPEREGDFALSFVISRSAALGDTDDPGGTKIEAGVRPCLSRYCNIDRQDLWHVCSFHIAPKTVTWRN